MNIIRIKKTDFFLMFVYFNVFCKGIGLDNDSIFYKTLLILGIVLLFYKVVQEYYTKNEVIQIIGIFLIGFFSFLETSKPTLLLTCICVIGMKNVDLDKLFKGMFKIRGITFFSVITLSLVGIIGNKSITMWRNGVIDVRYSLGYEHPNSLHLSLFLFICTYVYVRYSKFKFIDYLFISFINLFIFKYSLSRTGTLVIFIMLLLVFISKIKIKFTKKIIIKSCKYIFLILLIISFLFAFLYGKSDIVTKFDFLFNGRLKYSNYYISNYGFTIFGNYLAGDTNALFDNGYLYLYIQFGLSGLLLISSLIYLACKYIVKTQDVCKAIITISYLIYIFTESFSPNIFINNMLFFALPMIYFNRKEQYIKNE
jgi:hypothetical protein